MSNGDFVHIAQCEGICDKWKSLDITPPDQVSRTEAMARRARSPICETGKQANSCLWLFHFWMTGEAITEAMTRGAGSPICETAKQLSVALPFLDDWGGDHWLPQIGLRAPMAMAPQIPSHWAMCTKSPFAYRALSHALTVSLYLFLLKPQVFHLGWI